MAALQADFAARLQRMGYTADRGGKWRHDAGPAPVRAARRGTENLFFALSFPWAILVGFASVLLSRFTLFQFQGLPAHDADPNVLLMTDLAVAFAFAAVLRWAFDLKADGHMTCKSIGLVAGIFGMHNLVHYFPEPFRVLFSPEWVYRVLTSTPPDSLVFRDYVFIIG